MPAREVRLPCHLHRDDDGGDGGDDGSGDDGDHLLVEVDGTEASSCGNDAEQVEDPVELNF